MRILVISMLYEPDHAGIAPIATDLAHGLAQRGHAVTVQTTHPFYPEWRRKSSDSPWRVRREELAGVSVERYGLYVPASPSRLLPRLVHELSFPLSLLRGLFRGPRFDAVVVFCPLLGAVAYAALRKLVRGEPLWVNVQDIPVDAALGTGIGRNGLFPRAAARVQSLLFGSADLCSSISPAMVERLAGGPERRRAVHLRPNWLCGTLAQAVDALPDKVGRPAGTPLKLLYAGNIGRKQGLLEFCRRLAATDAALELRIHGDGAEAPALREWVAAHGDARFRMGEFLDETAFVRALHETDLFVITEQSGSGASFLPSKLIPCVASGTPVLCLCDGSGPLGQEVRAHELGIQSEWEDEDWLGAALALARDPVRLRRAQENCLRHARAYRREPALDESEQLLRRITGQDPELRSAPVAARVPTRS